MSLNDMNNPILKSYYSQLQENIATLASSELLKEIPAEYFDGDTSELFSNSELPSMPPPPATRQQLPSVASNITSPRLCSSRMSHNRSRATIITDNSVMNETTTSRNRRRAAFRFYLSTDDDESITVAAAAAPSNKRRKRILYRNYRKI